MRRPVNVGMPAIGQQTRVDGAAAPGQEARLRVLVADDQADVLVALGLLLKTNGFQTMSVNSPQAVLDAVTKQEFDAILMDLNYTRDTTSGEEGLELIEELKKVAGQTPILVMTAWATIDLAVEAMRRGATDFVLKPWENAALLDSIRRQVDKSRQVQKQEARRHSEEAKLRHDMSIAREVQQKLLPRYAGKLDGVEILGQCWQAGEVGGDYYDFIEISPGRTGIALADVSGKGIPAALLMANLQATLRSQCLRPERGIASMLRTVNHMFQQSTHPTHYATLFYGEMESGRPDLRYVNCGHNPPLMMRAGGAVEWLGPSATVVGAFETWSCEERTVRIDPGDLLLLYSDGVTEAGIANDEEFGAQRLVETVARGRGDTLEELAARILSAVEQWGGVEHGDDVTVIALRGTGAIRS